MSTSEWDDDPFRPGWTPPSPKTTATGEQERPGGPAGPGGQAPADPQGPADEHGRPHVQEQSEEPAQPGVHGPADPQGPADEHGRPHVQKQPEGPRAPGGPGAGFGAPTAPPWAGAPGVPGAPGPYGMPFPPPYAAPRNGFGTAALVLGIVGLVFGAIPVAFVLGGVLGVLALVFGLLGRARARRGEATNQGMALAGVVLGALAIVAVIVWAVFVGFVIAHAQGELDEFAEHGPSPSAPAVPGGSVEDGPDDEVPDDYGSDHPGSTEPLAWGRTHTYADGLKVTVGKPERYTPPAHMADSVPEGAVTLRVKLSLANGGTEPADIRHALPLLKDADGTEAEHAGNYEDTGLHLMAKEQLAPGERVDGTFSFTVPAETAGSLEVAVIPAVSVYGETVWTGPGT
ncbi:hypothetical protein BJP40_19340 [Streptomyces sp. CC53]|uniref:DUF4190 domain-containing protein n=1 Tax=unclassified Streptomyces TaxID=2593676 RepID=UPI0008DD9F13|nr:MULTISPECIES: DUF4190 domain-containing protein [unclassified Streptomyces]OII64844.1 hypothetical protein BJP40_19340 [Streptomyces sp. CC53]